MNDFTSTNISQNSEIISQELRRARITKNISIARAAQKTRINQKYLELLESGNFSQLPSGIYGKNFLREYAIFLGLDANSLIDLYEDEVGLNSRKKTEKFFSKKIPKINYSLNIHKITKGLVIAITVAICLLYLGFYLQKIVAAPKLIIAQPINNLTTAENVINIIGITEPEAKITINDETILANDDGSFKKEINLKNGINIINIVSQKKYSKKSEIIRQIFVESEQKP